jgi:hypothetical protein
VNTVVVVELQFARGAQHALAFHAAQLAQLDLERLAIVTGGQRCAYQSTRHLDARACVGCTAHDVEKSPLPDIHLAHAQAIGIGVLHRFDDFTHHHLAEGRCHRTQLFHLQTGHGQGVGELLGAQGRVAEFAQPGFRKLHGNSRGSWLTGTGAGNGCRRQRTGAGH